MGEFMNRIDAQLVTVEQLSEKSDEEIVISIDGNKLRCFVGVLPRGVIAGGVYPARLNLLVLEDYEIREIDDCVESIVSTSNFGYSYVITGRLVHGRLFAGGFVFDDDVLKDEYAYLADKCVEVRVDRIDVDFL